MGKKKEFVSQEYSAEKGGKNLKEGTKRSRVAAAFATGFFSVTAVIGLLLISFSIIFFFSKVDGTSMMKTLNASSLNTDSVIVNRYEKPKRGDIIVLKHYDASGNFKELHIKRLIAVGGESVYFHLEGDHYVVEIDGVPLEDLIDIPDTINGNNAEDIGFYKAYYEYQENGDLTRDLTIGSRKGNNDPDFATNAADGTPFRKEVTRTLNGVETTRYEIVLPQGYFFYMGDNRGGNGSDDGNYYNNTNMMSIDSTYFGPQPMSCIVGVVNEIIYNKSAPQWFWDKIVWAFSFKWL